MDRSSISQSIDRAALPPASCRRLELIGRSALFSRIEPSVKLTENSLPTETAGKKTLGVQWTGFFTPNESGAFLMEFAATGLAESAWTPSG